MVQTLVSLTLARGEVPVPLALRLYLPAEWTTDPGLCRRAGAPPEIGFQTKAERALVELDRVRAAGVRFGTVLVDADYGRSAEFRQALRARGLCWAVGVLRIQPVFRWTSGWCRPVGGASAGPRWAPGPRSAASRPRR